MKSRSVRVLLLAIVTTVLVVAAYDYRQASRHKAFEAKECSLVKQVAMVNVLAKYARKPGVFTVGRDSQKWTTVLFGRAHVTMPAIGNVVVRVQRTPLRYTLYREKRHHVSVLISTMHPASREFLGYITTPKLVQKFGNKSLYAYLVEALGVYTHGYCDVLNPEKKIAMFMAAPAAPPVPNGSKMIVYRLSRPRALLAVQAVPSPTMQALLMLPAKDPDAITYELISGPPGFITALVGSLSRQ